MSSGLKVLLCAYVIGVNGGYHRPSSYASANIYPPGFFKELSKTHYGLTVDGQAVPHKTLPLAQESLILHQAQSLQQEHAIPHHEELSHQVIVHHEHTVLPNHYVVPQIHQIEEAHKRPKYDFSYGVADHHTGDFKTHHETRDGDLVQGYYTVLDADGRTRRVDYRVDHDSGFLAKVTYSR